MIFTQEKFLSFNHCDIVIDYYEHTIDNHHSEDVSPDFYGRTIQLEQVDNPLIHHIMNDVRIRTSNLIRYRFNLNSNEFILPNDTQIVKWTEKELTELNNAMNIHSDNEDEDFHPSYYRTYSSILYLNEGYSGGETVIGGKTIQPKKGKLVCFKSDILHKVNNLIGIDRYTMAMWFTNIPQFYKK